MVVSILSAVLFFMFGAVALDIGMGNKAKNKLACVAVGVISLLVSHVFTLFTGMIMVAGYYSDEKIF